MTRLVLRRLVDPAGFQRYILVLRKAELKDIVVHVLNFPDFPPAAFSLQLDPTGARCG